MPERVLVLVGSEHLGKDELSFLGRCASRGARVVAWQHPIVGQDRFPSPDIARYLQALGIEATPLPVALGEPVNTEVEEAVIAWMKRLGRTPLGPSGSFRSTFRYGERSLWWWVELWLYYDTELRLHVRDIEALARLLEHETPDRVVVVGDVRQLAKVVRDLAKKSEVQSAVRALGPSRPRPSFSFLSELAKLIGAGGTSLLCKRSAPTESKGLRVLCLTHASMWRERRDPETKATEAVEMYFDQIIPSLRAEGNALRIVGVGPPVPFKHRTFSRKLRELAKLDTRGLPYIPLGTYLTPRVALKAAQAYFHSWRCLRRFERLPDLKNAFSHRGIELTSVGSAAMREAFLRLVPWALRSFEQVRAMLEVERPNIIVLYAESTALGRAVVAAASDAGVPSLAIQHGIMYPRYYSHEHASDEVRASYGGTDSVPLPDRTAVFGRMARDVLIERGHYPPEKIVITGSPKFDVLLRAGRTLRREEVRARLGLDVTAKMLIVASRFSSIGPVFGDLLRAAKGVPGLWLLVKPHQAEGRESYRKIAEQEASSRVRVLSSSANLLELIVASDGLITVDSFASSEALILGRPVLIVNLPNNLEMLVDKELAKGVYRGQDMTTPIRQLLDPNELAKLKVRLGRLRDEFAYGADGGSTERILQAVYAVASRKR